MSLCIAIKTSSIQRSHSCCSSSKSDSKASKSDSKASKDDRAKKPSKKTTGSSNDAGGCKHHPKSSHTTADCFKEQRLQKLRKEKSVHDGAEPSAEPSGKGTKELSSNPFSYPKGSCYNCGERGHMADKCPKPAAFFMDLEHLPFIEHEEEETLQTEMEKIVKIIIKNSFF